MSDAHSVSFPLPPPTQARKNGPVHPKGSGFAGKLHQRKDSLCTVLSIPETPGHLLSTTTCSLRRTDTSRRSSPGLRSLRDGLMCLDDEAD